MADYFLTDPPANGLPARDWLTLGGVFAVLLFLMLAVLGLTVLILTP